MFIDLPDPAQEPHFDITVIEYKVPTGATSAVQDIALTGSGEFYLIKEASNDSSSVELAEPSLISPIEMLSVISEAFGLPVKDYENIFGIKRATYYNWKKGIEPSDIHFKRIEALYDIALVVNEFNSHAYGRMAKTTSYDGKTLLSLLSEKTLNIDSIVSICHHLTKLISARSKGLEASKSDVVVSSVYFE